MKHYTSCLGLFVLIGISANAETITGRVVAVADGDTVTVLEGSKRQHKIRLAAIDAPEKAQPFGNRSKQHLSYLVYDKPVSIEWTKHDRYGRIASIRGQTTFYFDRAGVAASKIQNVEFSQHQQHHQRQAMLHH